MTEARDPALRALVEDWRLTAAEQDRLALTYAQTDDARMRSLQLEAKMYRNLATQIEDVLTPGDPPRPVPCENCGHPRDRGCIGWTDPT